LRAPAGLLEPLIGLDVGSPEGRGELSQPARPRLLVLLGLLVSLLLGDILE